MTPTPALPKSEHKAVAVREMFDRIAPRYDLVNRLITAGLDVRWRRRAVAALALPRGALVLDLACGTGDFVVTLGRCGYRAIGVDYAAAMLARAHRRSPAPLVRADVLHLPLATASVDGATCGFALRNVTDIQALLGEMARVVRPGGRVALLELGEPEGAALLRAGHRLYLHRIVPMVGALLSDPAAYRYLPASTTYLPPWPLLVAMLEGAGFTAVERHALGLGAAQLMVAARQ